jgi:hypothetical protein
VQLFVWAAEKETDSGGLLVFSESAPEIQSSCRTESTSLNAMSVSDISWNSLGLSNHFPGRQDLYQQDLQPSAAFLSHEISHLSNPVYTNRTSRYNMNTLSPDEMKRFQELSNEFEADVQVSDGC